MNFPLDVHLWYYVFQFLPIGDLKRMLFVCRTFKEAGSIVLKNTMEYQLLVERNLGKAVAIYRKRQHSSRDVFRWKALCYQEEWGEDGLTRFFIGRTQNILYCNKSRYLMEQTGTAAIRSRDKAIIRKMASHIFNETCLEMWRGVFGASEDKFLWDLTEELGWDRKDILKTLKYTSQSIRALFERM